MLERAVNAEKSQVLERFSLDRAAFEKMSLQEKAAVLDPFLGSGATAQAAKRTGRKFVGSDLDAGNVKAAEVVLAGLAVRADDVGVDQGPPVGRVGPRVVQPLDDEPHPGVADEHVPDPGLAGARGGKRVDPRQPDAEENSIVILSQFIQGFHQCFAVHFTQLFVVGIHT